MAQFTEEEKTIRRIEKRFSKGLVEYGLIEDGDKILIGLSGGKDSLALVNCWQSAPVSLSPDSPWLPFMWL